MFELRRFLAADLLQLDSASGATAEQMREAGAAIESLARAWTGVRDGRVVGCAGIIANHPGNARVWGLFTPEIPRGAWPRIVRLIQAELDAAPEPRIEATCPVAFGAGVGFLRWLGFEVESKARQYARDGDHFVFALVRERKAVA